MSTLDQEEPWAPGAGAALKEVSAEGRMDGEAAERRKRVSGTSETRTCFGICLAFGNRRSVRMLGRLSHLIAFESKGVLFSETISEWRTPT